MALAHSLGFPRIGKQRQLKFAVESFWHGEINEIQLLEKGLQFRKENWAIQSETGLSLLPAGDFSWYDQVLDTSILLGVIPERYKTNTNQSSLLTCFHMARGQAPGLQNVSACEMTKWFDTNYHYIVPEFKPNQAFTVNTHALCEEITQAHELGHHIKPILIGPLSYLWLGKCYPQSFDKLSLLPQLIHAYKTIIKDLIAHNIEWVQIDEPILTLDLPEPWRKGFQEAFEQLQSENIKILLTTYFGALEANLGWVMELPVAGLHLDGLQMPEQISSALALLNPEQVLSVGIVNGRNIWKTDLTRAVEFLRPVHEQLGDRLWIAGSCSFMHTPVDLRSEHGLDPEIMQWLAFARQKTEELVLIETALNEGVDSVLSLLQENQQATRSRTHSQKIHNPEVANRLETIPDLPIKRTPYAKRHMVQQKILNLPLLPTTTIGSFPQTSVIRKLRLDHRRGMIDTATYEQHIREEIRHVIEKQIETGLDVLVHGEAERNDMVEYFADKLEGFAFTQHGWVQSYGSRCVKPPIIYGDVSRPNPITVRWSHYAQSLTDKPVKGMLTGPATIVMWSFVRDDQSRYTTMQQIALALRDEVQDLEGAGIKVIQIDEPAFREGLPLRHAGWAQYLEETVKCFQITAGCAADHTQIHTHMCYSEFNDIIAAIADLDADVISIETSRSNMELLEAFKSFSYPNEIGPGVYDIHSPRIPEIAEIRTLIEKAARLIPVERLWINPDCGLKTRTWPEVDSALHNMVEAARQLRSYFKNR